MRRLLTVLPILVGLLAGVVAVILLYLAGR